MLTIYTTSLSYRVPVTEFGQIKGTHLNLKNYCDPFMDYKYNHIIRRWMVNKKYRYYNIKTQYVYMPRYDLTRFKTFLDMSNVPYCTVELPSSSGVDIEVDLQSWAIDRDVRQTKAIAYLTQCDEPVLGLSLQTGVGKTYCTIKTVSILKKRTIICVNGLLDQWVQAILKFTTLKESDIFVIKGSDALVKILTRIDKSLFPKFIVCSTGTIRNYCSDKDAYENYPPFEELCDRLGVGIRVTDEAHLNFHTNLMMDLRLNTAKTIVLTATFDVSNTKVKDIFDGHYPETIRFGEEDYKQYVDIFAYSYSTGVHDIPSFAYKSKDGYSHTRLEAWLLRKTYKLESIFSRVYLPIIQSHYINEHRPGQKLLILCSSIQMCEWIRDRLLEEYPNYKIAIYISETDDAALIDNDIIVSTPSSAGTGRDIANLKTMLVTVSVRSAPLNKQMLGRLRELTTGDAPVYISVYHRDIVSQVSHHGVREVMYRELGKSYTHLTL